MDKDFWHRRWQRNEIGFHASKPNDFLVQYFEKLALPPDSLVFVPLCGKTLDISWLLAQGHRVVGIELDLTAVEQLFQQLDMVPEKQDIGDTMCCYQGPGIKIYQGDFFELTQAQLGSVDAIYDRAALVALPENMRVSYCQHMLEICSATKQLLVVFEYDQSQMSGPPFSVTESDIRKYYGRDYKISKLEIQKSDVRGLAVDELAWLLIENKK